MVVVTERAIMLVLEELDCPLVTSMGRLVLTPLYATIPPAAFWLELKLKVSLLGSLLPATWT